MNYQPPLPGDTGDREADMSLPPNGFFRGLVFAIPVCLAFWIIIGLIVWAVFVS